MLRRALLIIVLPAASIAAACGNNQIPTTPSSIIPTRSNEIFGGTLAPGDSQFYSFSVAQSGPTDVTLLSLRPAGVATSTLNIVVGIGLGTPAGTGCALSSAINTAPGLTKQLSATTNVNTYCVKIADIGNLMGAVDYTVRILHF